MNSVGIRELRQRASDLLRQVEAGKTIQITDRGRPIALLTPLPEGSELARLRRAGETSTPTGDFDDLPEPLALPTNVEKPSKRLMRLRQHER